MFIILALFKSNVYTVWTITKQTLCKLYVFFKCLFRSKSSQTAKPKTKKMSRPSKIIKLMKNIKPTRMWIDGKCFCISKYDEPESDVGAPSTQIEEYKTRYNINFADNLYHTSFRLPGVYYEKVHRHPHFTIKDLEELTSTTIQIPQESNESITVSSKDIENVIDARSKLHSVFSVIRDSENALQFISIPTRNVDIQEKFECFKKEVLQIENVHGMHESIFQKPERLHLTVAVFSLLDDIEKSEAIKVLDECKDKIIDPIVSESGPLKIKISGIECMNNDYRKVNILYANAKICTEKDEDILQSILNSISKHFYERGFTRQYQENVKIHVTLMNTKYRKIKGKKRKWKDKKQAFDASTIMKKYKDFHFGECDLNEIHLSWIAQMDSNGFYKPLSIITV